MDFLENFLGFTPDGGTGATELLVIAALAVSAVIVTHAGRRLLKAATKRGRR